jgi:hypothetical protein
MWARGLVSRGRQHAKVLVRGLMAPDYAHFFCWDGLRVDEGEGELRGALALVGGGRLRRCGLCRCGGLLDGRDDVAVLAEERETVEL